MYHKRNVDRHGGMGMVSNQPNGTAINNMTYTYECPNNCPYYLPCGYCSKMCRPCFRQNGWTYTTTSASTVDLGDKNEGGS